MTTDQFIRQRAWWTVVVTSVLCAIPTFISRTQDLHPLQEQGVQKPLRIGVVGLVHTHVHWILGRAAAGDIEIVGIAEPNQDLAQRYAEQHGYPMDMVFSSMEEMIEQTQPEAVTAFNTIHGHLQVVEYCAPRGIHVMVEKPLAVNLDHARKMAALVKEHGIQLLTNYETTWYGCNAEAFHILHHHKSIGDLRKIIFYTGHPGPIEIGCNAEFLEWLTDPLLNGGGALTDFGCYGASLATWFMLGQQPVAVSCVTQQIKPQLYPKVEDDATIILEYHDAQVVIMASWNWSHNRKEMELYGKHGYVFCRNGSDMEVMESESAGPFTLTAEALPHGVHDPFAYLSNVVAGRISVQPFSPSSLENNMIVMQILEAAKLAATTGERVLWSEMFPE